jgi:hypothetical protein
MKLRRKASEDTFDDLSRSRAERQSLRDERGCGTFEGPEAKEEDPEANAKEAKSAGGWTDVVTCRFCLRAAS